MLSFTQIIMKRHLLVLLLFLPAILPAQGRFEHEIIGVYQGNSLFVQNPFHADVKEFCIRSIFVNNNVQNLNYRMSALKLDFDENDVFTPVTIRIVTSDSLCHPVIINPNAILFHTAYKFLTIELSDSVLVWTTEGERETGTYFIEKLIDGYWEEQVVIQAKSRFEEASYSYVPSLDEGSNKYRVRYEFGNGRYLYSTEADYDYYPEPVEFFPKSTRDRIRFSRAASYEIFDQKNQLVLSGNGTEVDVAKLWPGDYVIYFDGRDPGVFTKTSY